MKNITSAAKGWFRMPDFGEWVILAGMAAGVGVAMVASAGLIGGVGLALAGGMVASVGANLLGPLFAPKPAPPVPVSETPEARKQNEKSQQRAPVQAQGVAAARPITSVKTQELVQSSVGRGQLSALTPASTPIQSQASVNQKENAGSRLPVQGKFTEMVTAANGAGITR